MATLGVEIDSVNVGPPLLARRPSTRDGTVWVIIPGPNPIATQVPSLSIEASPIGVIARLSLLQSFKVLRTISELVIRISSPHEENERPIRSSDTVTFVSVSEAQPIPMPP